MFERSLRACAVIGLALALLGPGTASASEPSIAPTQTLVGPLAQLDEQTQTHESLAAVGPAMPSLALEVPALLAMTPGPASFIAPPVLAKRAKDRKFDTSLGEVDPRVHNRPRTHRFRFTLHAQHVRLTQTVNPAGETVRFHYAPMMFDLGYQAQFLKYVMVRLAVAVGGNVANTRNAMPLAVFPQGYLGLQTKIIGVAFGYGFDWTIPPTFGAAAQGSNSVEQPVITRNHVVMGELSATSKIDRVALTFSFAFGGMQSDLTHFSTSNRKFRPYIGLQAGMFFDGTIRREKKARKRAEAQGL